MAKSGLAVSMTGCLAVVGLAVALAGDDGLRAAPAPKAMPVPQQAQLGAAPLASPQQALINRYCVGCHNARLKTGGLALDTVDVDHIGEDTAVWEKAVRKLRARAMPPAGPGRLRPDEASYESMISHLETSLDRVAVEKPDPGRTDTFHRLNRTEYQNAIRDLLALSIDATSLL